MPDASTTGGSDATNPDVPSTEEDAVAQNPDATTGEADATEPGTDAEEVDTGEEVDAGEPPRDAGGCNPGQRLVNGRCVNCSSIQACGLECQACPPPGANGRYSCAGNTMSTQDSCTLTCSNGFRNEGGTCVACNEVAACGNNCGACPANPSDGTYECSGNTSPSSSACMLMCNGGFRAANGMCRACDSTTSCGSDCQACPANPQNGTYACMGNSSSASQACVLTCSAGFTLVNGVCERCATTTACGNDCQGCPPDPAGGTYACSGNAQPAATACTLSCNGGAMPMNGACVACGTAAACGSDCAACPASPANGSYSCSSDQIPASQACTLTCNNGFRRDNNSCNACNSTASCGSDCGACPANPANGAYMCSGNGTPAATACTLTCNAGFRAVNGQCVACNASAACGSDCGACPANPANGAYMCSNNTQPAANACAITCNAGFRLNGNQCVPCNAIGACGNDCQACPANPPGGTFMCSGNTQPAATACTLTCGAGQRASNGQCVACNVAAQCGSDCAACPAPPANGVYTCAGNTQPAANACTLGCAAGFRLNGNQCVACSSTAQCGSDCAACPANPANGTYACAGNTQPAGQSCMLTCGAGLRPVNGQCVACDTPTQCGNNCGACPANPANGTYTCLGNGQPSGTACNLTCNPGFMRSGNACVPCNSTAQCGSDCAACPANPAGGTFACGGNTQPAAQACTLTCAAGFRAFGGSCQPCNASNACGSDCAACPTAGGPWICNGNTQPAAQSCQQGCPAGQRRVNGQCVACTNMSACLNGCGTCVPNPNCAGDTSDPPVRLECTYYFDSAANATARIRSPDIYPFDPGFHLWSDGAEKERYIYLPPNSQIDTTNMDEWTFPVGTRVFKDFAVRDQANPAAPAQLVETRLLYKLPNGLWNRSVYVWTANGAVRYDGSTGLVTPANVRGPSGVGTPTEDPGAIAAGTAVPGATLNGMTTTYEIPPADVCGRCHQGRIDNLLGFEAVSLSTPESGACDNATPGNPCLTMTEAIRNGLVSAPPAQAITVPGNATERAAIGFLHANCGTCCHNPSTFAQANFTGFFMRLETAQLALNNVTMLNTYTTGIRVRAGWQINDCMEPPTGTRFRITPGNADQSIVIYRMTARNTRRMCDGDLEQMPPLATHVPTTEGLNAVRTWMNALP